MDFIRYTSFGGSVVRDQIAEFSKPINTVSKVCAYKANTIQIKYTNILHKHVRGVIRKFWVLIWQCNKLSCKNKKVFYNYLC